MPDRDTPQRGEQLQSEVEHLRETLHMVEVERERHDRRRRRDLLILGVAVSLVIHMLVMFYLALQQRAGAGGTSPQPVQFAFTVVQDETLTELESLQESDLETDMVTEQTELESAIESLEPAAADAQLALADAGDLPTLGGLGSGGEEGGLGGGGGAAGASFFGVTSRGMRFAFIVDRSGSMGQQRKMAVAMKELARSIGGLPDYASYFVVLFSSDLIGPTQQSGWTKATKANVNRLVRWLNQIDPSGGTFPMPAFQEIFALTVRPDVIFFLTDGQIPADSADRVAALNARGPRVVINTIAFGDPSSQNQLKRMAEESGGVYRFVPAGRP